MRAFEKLLKSLPVRDGKDALNVNWINVRISTPGVETAYNASFITDPEPDKSNIVEMARCARCRWKIENKTFNMLKNHGYHLETQFRAWKNQSFRRACGIESFSLQFAFRLRGGGENLAKCQGGMRFQKTYAQYSLELDRIHGISDMGFVAGNGFNRQATT